MFNTENLIALLAALPPETKLCISLNGVLAEVTELDVQDGMVILKS